MGRLVVSHLLFLTVQCFHLSSSPTWCLFFTRVLFRRTVGGLTVVGVAAAAW